MPVLLVSYHSELAKTHALVTSSIISKTSSVEHQDVGKKTHFDIILKFILGSEACENKTKEMYYSWLSLMVISFVLFP